jgi:protein-S-isoprenylcysteine O-methyltransferase Ste14
MTVAEFSMLEHVGLAAGWIAWCALHSLLITHAVTDRLRRRFGAHYAWFRFVYVVISVLTLLPLLWWQWRIPTPLYWSWQLPWSLLQWTLLGVSGIIMYLGARQYDQPFFFGIRQIRDHLSSHDAEYAGFEAKGILARVRHPYYTAGILFLLAFGDITAANVILKSVGIAYFIIGAFLEEKKLIAEFGEQYRDYRRRVPMFVPRLRGGRVPGHRGEER